MTARCLDPDRKPERRTNPTTGETLMLCNRHAALHDMGHGFDVKRSRQLQCKLADHGGTQNVVMPGDRIIAVVQVGSDAERGRIAATQFGHLVGGTVVDTRQNLGGAQLKWRDVRGQEHTLIVASAKLLIEREES